MLSYEEFKSILENKFLDYMTLEWSRGGPPLW